VNDNFPTPQPSSSRGVAIIGLACVFPKARTLEEFWWNIVNKVDAVTDAPPERLDLETGYDPNPNAQGKVYCKKGGWIGESFAFNPAKYGIMPSQITGSEPDQFLMLRTVYEAMEDAGYLDRKFDGTRVSVTIGKGNFTGPGQMTLTNRTLAIDEIANIVRGLEPELSKEEMDKIRRIVSAPLPPMTPDLATGIIPNVLAGRVSNRMDLMGRNLTVDAACASSLIAVEVAVAELLSGISDMAIVGGIHTSAFFPLMCVFASMRASSLTSTIRPYDQEADGTILGEGAGVLVLKRLEDAERDRDRIYAVIRGVGSSSDGKAKSVVAPRVEGAELAMRRAYQMAGVPPSTVELIEGHGTGTGIGDVAEIEAIGRVFGESQDGRASCALGSVKSMIGHTMAAAGSAGLIKTILGLYHGILPPSIHCRTPRAPLQKPESRFYVNSEPRPWIHSGDGGPRRAGVNAFGFGGVNAHVVLEEYTGNRDNPPPSLYRKWESEVVILEGGSRRELCERMDLLAEYASKTEGVTLLDIAYTCNTAPGLLNERIAFVASSLEDLREKLTRARALLEQLKGDTIRDQNGIYYFSDPELIQGKVALLFPGEGSQYVNMMSDLAMHFPAVRDVFDKLGAILRDNGGQSINASIFPPPFFSEEEAIQANNKLYSADRAVPAVILAEIAMIGLMRALGFGAPDMMMGHSTGDWTAIIVSGVVELDEFFSTFGEVGAIYTRLAGNKDVRPMAMLAVGAGRERVETLVNEIARTVHIANDNCPHQVVIVVELEDEAEVSAHLRRHGVYFEKLPYERGYHTPAYAEICAPLREYLGKLHLRAPLVPLYSSTSGQLYPSDPDAIRDLVSTTFARPVLFGQTIDTMYEAGARIFLEAGARGNVTAFVDDILRGRTHLAVPMDRYRRPGLTTLNHAVAMLAAAHRQGNLEPLYDRRGARRLAFDPREDNRTNPDLEKGVVQVSTTSPHLGIPDPVVHKSHPQTPAPAAHGGDRAPAAVAPAAPLPAGPQVAHAAFAARSTSAPPAALVDHFAIMEEFLSTQEAVMAHYLGGPALDSSERTVAASVHAAPRTAVLEPPPAAPRTEVKSTAAAPSKPAPPASVETPPSGASLQERLIQAVSVITGYPSEMISLDADMESEMGIDYLKRLHILETLLPKEYSASKDPTRDWLDAAEVTTLRGLLDLIGKHGAAMPAAPSAPLQFGPMLRASTVVEHQQGQSIRLRCEIDSREHLYIADHCLYQKATEWDNQDSAICCIPMTCTLELMAEAAVLLTPGRLVVGARGVQARRWINVIENGPSTFLSIQAKKSGVNTVHVTVRDELDGKMELCAEGTLVVGDAYAPPPAPMDLVLENPTAPTRTSKDNYGQKYTFHGPRFQGVVSFDAVGDNGIVGKLQTLPRHNLLQSNPDPQFQLDGFLLDAAGQIVGYWPLDRLQEGESVLPVLLNDLKIYRGHLRPGEGAEVRVRIREVGRRRFLVDYDVLDADGKVYMRIEGWMDWRFYWVPEVRQFWRTPKTIYLGDRLEFPSLTASDVECVHLEIKDEGNDQGELWEMIRERTVFSRRELEYLNAIPEKEARHAKGAALCAATEAVRRWVKRHFDRDLYPADVEIAHTPDGRFRATGQWVEELGLRPFVSTCNEGMTGYSVASERQIGIATVPASLGFEHAARTAAAQLLGRDSNPDDFRLLDSDELHGCATLCCGESTLRAHSLRHEDRIVAIAVLQEATHADVQ